MKKVCKAAADSVLQVQQEKILFQNKYEVFHIFWRQY